MATNKTVNIYNSEMKEVNINMVKDEEPVKTITLNWLPVASCFQGRRDIFANIQKMFEANRLIVLHGMPGIGKTETARHFGTINREHYHGNLVWIYAQTPENIKKCFRDLAKTLKLEIPDAFQIFNKLRTSKALFVFDNAENMAAIKEYLPSNQLHPNVDVLITSQFAEWDSSVCKIHLKPLNLEDGMEIFREKLQDKFQKYPNEIWEQLVKELDRIPLCLQIVSSMIKQKLRISNFNVKKFTLNLKDNFINTTIPESEQNFYNKTVSAAINSALSRLEEEKPFCSLDVLCFIAYLDADWIYANELLIPSIGNSKVLLEESLYKLIDYSLIQVVKYVWMKIKIHRTIQIILREYDLKKRNGIMFKTVLQASLCDIYSINSQSVSKHLKQKEFLGKAIEFYHENKSLTRKYFVYLARYHCNEILKIVLPKLKTDKPILIEMLLQAIDNENHNLKTIQLLIKHITQNEENVRWIEAESSWPSMKLLHILLQANIYGDIQHKSLIAEKILLAIILKSNKTNSKESIGCIKYLKEHISTKPEVPSKILREASRSQEITFEIIKFIFQEYNLKKFVCSQTILDILLNRNCSNTETFEIFCYLVKESEADITIQIESKTNILFHICMLGSFEMIDFILREKDCSQIINVKDTTNGDVPFTILIYNVLINEADKIKLINLFLKNKMDFNVKNKNNESLVEIAQRKGLMQLSEELKKC